VARDDRVEVELVDPDTPEDAAAPPTRDGSDPVDGPPPATADRRRRWPFVAAAAAVVGALLVTQGVLDARERAQLARYAEIDGVLPLMDETIRVLWELDGRATPLLYASTTVDGRLVGARFETSGAQVAVALDARTGEVAWSTPLAAAEEIMAGEENASVQCMTVTDPAGPVLTCVVQTDHALGPEPSTPEQGPAYPVPGAAELVTLDARTGHVVHSEPAPVDLHLASVGGTLVTAESEADGSITVRGVDPRTGAESWHVAGLVDPAGGEGPAEPALALRSSPPDSVLVQTPGTAWMVSAEGKITATIRQDVGDDVHGWYVGPLRSGDLALQVFAENGMTTSLLDASGTEVRTELGMVTHPFPDDGSVDRRVFMQGEGGALAVWDPRTGEQAWVNDELGYGDGVVLDGVYYVNGTRDTLVAIDLASGETVWRASDATGSRVVDVTSNPVLTDGRVVVSVQPAGASVVLEAYSRTDGTYLWSADLPEGITSVTVHGDLLVGWSDDGERAVVLG
jgi:outer membrane protein assembly factor BamB